MAKEKMTKELLSLIRLSTMESKEKAMWMVLIPQMDDRQIEKLADSMKREAEAMNGLLLKALKSK